MANDLVPHVIDYFLVSILPYNSGKQNSELTLFTPCFLRRASVKIVTQMMMTIPTILMMKMRMRLKERKRLILRLRIRGLGRRRRGIEVWGRSMVVPKKGQRMCCNDW